MDSSRFKELTAAYRGLKIAILGDFCLDRYLEIDPEICEDSIETGLPVHNVVHTRSQPGGAGTILNNLSSLGVGDIIPVGFAGHDGEGWELREALARVPGVRLDHFLSTAERRTFTYTKPLIIEAKKHPRELNRLDMKNWTPTPTTVTRKLVESLRSLVQSVDVVILLEQVEHPETGVLTKEMLEEVGKLALPAETDLIFLADSRQGLGAFPPLTFKMNLDEFTRFQGISVAEAREGLEASASSLAAQLGQRLFITLAGEGILGAAPSGESHRAPALPSRGEIDIVGAGDAVTANLAASLAAGASLGESLDMAMAAASVVVHKLGTTGTASCDEILDIFTPK